MKYRFLLLAAAVALGSCANLSNSDLARMRSRGIPPALVQKLEHGRPLAPEEVATLSRRGVPAETLVRHIHRTGASYLLAPGDARQSAPKRSGAARD